MPNINSVLPSLEKGNPQGYHSFHVPVFSTQSYGNNSDTYFS